MIAFKENIAAPKPSIGAARLFHLLARRYYLI